LAAHDRIDLDRGIFPNLDFNALHDSQARNRDGFWLNWRSGFWHCHRGAGSHQQDKENYGI
jgi:hypothetical protein